MAIDDEQRLRPAPDVVSRVLDGEAVLLHLGRGTYFGLNEVGTRVWELLADGPTVRELQERIVAEFDVEPETAAQDVRELVEQLMQRDLIGGDDVDRRERA